MTDYDNSSLLHIACEREHSSVIKFLVKSKINLNAFDRWNQTPLDLVKKPNIK